MPSKFRGMGKKIKDKKSVEIALQDALAEVTSPVEEVLIEVLEAATKPITKAVVHQAHNVYYDSTKKKFVLITIEYNPHTNECRVVSKEDLADSQTTALYKLQNKFALKVIRAGESI